MREEAELGFGSQCPHGARLPSLSLGPISQEGLGASLASLSSENPYATIRDLPGLLGGLRESSYVEMKGPPSGSPPRHPPPLRDSQRWPHPQSQRDSGTYEQPSPLPYGESLFSAGAGATGTWDERGRKKG